MRGIREAIATSAAVSTLLFGGCSSDPQAPIGPLAPIESPKVIDCMGNETNAIPTYLGDPAYSSYRDPNVLKDYQFAHINPGEYYGVGTLVCNYMVKTGGSESGPETRLVLTKIAMDVAHKLLQEGK